MGKDADTSVSSTPRAEEHLKSYPARYCFRAFLLVLVSSSSNTDFFCCCFCCLAAEKHGSEGVGKSFEGLREDSKASIHWCMPLPPNLGHRHPHQLLPWFGCQGELISYHGLLQALPPALPVLAWFCGSSWPAALQTSVP